MPFTMASLRLVPLGVFLLALNVGLAGVEINSELEISVGGDGSSTWCPSQHITSLLLYNGWHLWSPHMLLPRLRKICFTQGKVLPPDCLSKQFCININTNGKGANLKLPDPLNELLEVLSKRMSGLLTSGGLPWSVMKSTIFLLVQFQAALTL